MTRWTCCGASVSVSDVTDGKASLHKWRLHLDNEGSDLLSDEMSTRSPTAEQVKYLIFLSLLSILLSAKTCYLNFITTATSTFYFTCIIVTIKVHSLVRDLQAWRVSLWLGGFVDLLTCDLFDWESSCLQVTGTVWKWTDSCCVQICTVFWYAGSETLMNQIDCKINLDSTASRKSKTNTSFRIICLLIMIYIWTLLWIGPSNHSYLNHL